MSRAAEAIRPLPTRRGYKVAALVTVLAAAGAFAWFNYALVRQTDAVNDFERLPARGEVVFDAPGTYTVWAGRPCNGFCRPEAASVYQRHLTLRLTGVERGQEVVAEPFPGSGHYRIGGGREGRAVWLVEIPEAGAYAVTRRNDGEVSSPPLLVGEGSGLPVTIRSGVAAIGGTGAALAVALAVATYVRRRRAWRDRLLRLEDRI